ncbi:uncharacterized protein Hap1MRO34_004479 isoform 2-T2 [Clarias gariepinus]|uniref:uncharacterized protein LOC128519651 n=1 Tax=Clarias gariepinus TaxID=13013 RepID=UPI00234D598E|nr:uncharacterized protein LOC128519651 [Clarias gariepinus]
MCSSLSMKTLLWFYLLVCCVAAQSFTEKSVDLGQNVTLKCEVAVSHVYWYLIKPSEPPLFVLRSFSRKMQTPEYSNRTLSKSFSLKLNGTLYIHRISTNELGVYYCLNTALPAKMSRGIRLYIQNNSAEYQNKSDRQFSILVVLVILTCALAVVATVFTVFYCRRLPKPQAQSPVPGVQLHQDVPNVVYSEVQHKVMNRPVRTSDHNTTYARIRPSNP